MEESLTAVFHGSTDSEKSYLPMRYPELRAPSWQCLFSPPSLTCQASDKSLLLTAMCHRMSYLLHGVLMKMN